MVIFASMKIIRNKYLPIGKNFWAINILGIVFTKGKLSRISENHEYIHTLQQREMLFVFFYLWYIVEWIFRWIQFRDREKGYYHISFEQEAYCNQRNLLYTQQRTFFAWTKFLKRKRHKESRQL